MKIVINDTIFVQMEIADNKTVNQFKQLLMIQFVRQLKNRDG